MLTLLQKWLKNILKPGDKITLLPNTDRSVDEFARDACEQGSWGQGNKNRKNKIF